MAKYSFANLGKWSDKVQRNADLVFAGAAEDTMGAMTEGAAGVSRGGTVQRGKVPVADGELINSYDQDKQFFGLKIGDTITGTFSAPHAPVKNYGGNGQPGWFFRENAVEQFPAFVAANARKFR